MSMRYSHRPRNDESLQVRLKGWAARYSCYGGLMLLGMLCADAAFVF